jgi:mannose-6-phosphate isomerase-like protein (cupin superfamily)
MKRARLDLRRGFRVLLGNRRAQAAVMVISRGSGEGGARNRHRGADQWLLVLDGKGEAIVNDRRYPLSRGSLLLIERGDRHEIRGTGRKPLKTINVDVPPAYRADGEELPAGKR